MDTSFRKILFCTDFSKGAANAFRYALKAARTNGAELHILHVMAEADAQFWNGYVVEDGQDLAEKNRKALIDKIQASYGSDIPQGIAWSAHMATGPAADKIAEFVRSNGISLVVLGRPRPRFLRTFLFGSVAAKVARTVACPLLVVPEQEDA